MINLLALLDVEIFPTISNVSAISVWLVLVLFIAGCLSSIISRSTWSPKKKARVRDSAQKLPAGRF